MIIISVLWSLWIFPKSFIFLLFPFSYKSDIFQGTHLKKIIRRRAKRKSSPKWTIPLRLPTQYFSPSIPLTPQHKHCCVLAWSWSGWGSQGEKLAWRRSWPSALHRIAWPRRTPEIMLIWDPDLVHINSCKNPSSQAGRWFWVTAMDIFIRDSRWNILCDSLHEITR